MKHITSLFCLALLISSCGANNSGSKSEKAAKESAPMTYETAFQKAFGPRSSITPDTLALGYFTGMTKMQTGAHVKSLTQNKKVQYRSYKGYMYSMPLTHFAESGNLTENYSFRVSTEHYKDTLQALHLWLKSSDNNHSGYALTTKYNDLTMEDLYQEFGPIFESKGYIGKAVDPSETLTTDPQFGIPAAQWKGTEYRFVKDNTLIRLWKGREWDTDFFISYYDMAVLYNQQQDIAAKEAAEAKKAAEENAAREEQKKDYLRDF